jgi:hypothetical protein
MANYQTNGVISTPQSTNNNVGTVLKGGNVSNGWRSKDLGVETPASIFRSRNGGIYATQCFR